MVLRGRPTGRAECQRSSIVQRACCWHQTESIQAGSLLWQVYSDLGLSCQEFRAAAGLVSRLRCRFRASSASRSRRPWPIRTAVEYASSPESLLAGQES